MTYDTINDAVTRAGGAGTLLAGRYRIVRQLGQGGMGSVWLAEDTQLDNKPFAIKMLPSILVSNKRAYRQLKDEALVAMQLVHPNIVQIRAFEENDGNPFLVMDYVDGQTLDDYLAEKGTLTEDEVIRILRPIAAALDYAHAKGVVHRDVKPGNVMIAKDGTPSILDFGIAHEIQETMTRVTGKLSSGTLLYMSPEQLMGEKPTPAQDVYSFAAMAYECLKGAPPFSHGQIEFQIMNKQPEPLCVATGETPVAGSDKSVASPNCASHRGSGALAASVMSGLAKKPEDRPATCAAVLRGSGVSAASVGTMNGSGKSAASPNPQQPGGSRLSRPDEAQGGRGRSPSGPQSAGPRSRAAVMGILVAALLAIVGGVWWALSRTGNLPVREVAATHETVDSSVREASPTGGTGDTFVQETPIVHSYALTNAPMRNTSPVDKAPLITTQGKANLPGPIKRPPLIVNQPSGTNAVNRSSPIKRVPRPLPVGRERPATYVVQPGETLGDIAQRFYGSRKKWRDIQNANMATISPDGRMKAGQVLRLPSDAGQDKVNVNRDDKSKGVSSLSTESAVQTPAQEVLARVSTDITGYVSSQSLNSGDFVEKGELIMRLTRNRNVVRLRRAEAMLAAVEYRGAMQIYERMKKADFRGITQRERDHAESELDKTRAVLHQSLATLTIEEFDSMKGDIVAPVSGKVRFATCVGNGISCKTPFVAEIHSPDSHFGSGTDNSQEIEIYSHRKGRVVEICVKEGDVVKRGDLLCRFDDGQESLLVDKRKADLEVAEAEFGRAERYLKRLQNADAHGITQCEYDNAVLNVEKAKAVVGLARARLFIARGELVSARVVSPASGKITKVNIQIGEVVDPDEVAVAKMSCDMGHGFLREMLPNIEVVRANDPARYAQMTNNLARFRQRSQHRTKDLIALLSSVDTSRFTPKERQDHEALRDAIVKSDELCQLLNPCNDGATDEQRKMTMRQLRKLEQAVYLLKSSERNTLFTKFLDFQNEDVTDKQRKAAFELLLELLQRLPGEPPGR